MWALLATPFSVAAIGSLLLHMQAYWGLAQLPKGFAGIETGSPEPTVVELAFQDFDELERPSTEVEERLLPVPEKRTPRPRVRPPSLERPTPSEPQPSTPQPVVPEAPRPQPVADPAERTAVTQRSQNQEPPPETARYIADQNNRVEEETVAEFRNDERDDAEQQLADEQPAIDEGAGNAEETASAATEGADEAPPEAEAPQQVATSPAPATSAAQRLPSGAERAAPAAEAGGENQAEATVSVAAQDFLTVSDGSGTFQVPDLTSSAERSGNQTGTGESASSASEDENRARRAELEAALGIGGEQPSVPNLRIARGDLEGIVSGETLDSERSEWVQRRRARLRGSNRGERWRQFRSAIENYVAKVRPGNQTALNAAANPFAQYLAAMHRKLHRHFAHSFLGTLPSDPNHPLSDRSLVSRLEIILNRDGSIHRVGIVRQSGNLVFDQGAFTAVHNGAPYGNAPPGILSDDGHVYLHWGFYRNQRQCGTFNARPYLVRATPLQDEGDGDGIEAPGTEDGAVPAGQDEAVTSQESSSG